MYLLQLLYPLGYTLFRDALGWKLPAHDAARSALGTCDIFSVHLRFSRLFTTSGLVLFLSRASLISPNIHILCTPNGYQVDFPLAIQFSFFLMTHEYAPRTFPLSVALSLPMLLE